MLSLHQALDVLAETNPKKARIEELKYFGGLSCESIGQVLGVSRRTVERGWDFART